MTVCASICTPGHCTAEWLLKASGKMQWEWQAEHLLLHWPAYGVGGSTRQALHCNLQGAWQPPRPRKIDSVEAPLLQRKPRHCAGSVMQSASKSAHGNLILALRLCAHHLQRSPACLKLKHPVSTASHADVRSWISLGRYIVSLCIAVWFTG